MGDNTYATIQPRNLQQLGELADYATLRNNNSRAPSVFKIKIIITNIINQFN